MMQKIKSFIQKEVVLCVATILAIISMFIVIPDKGYIEYFDFRVLALLFSLMVVMAGFMDMGIFRRIAMNLLKKAQTYRQLILLLVFICFFTAMFITNDVALITFVPFTIMLLNMAGMKEKIISVVVFQTIAANLGSMLTPLGNPQNLYLYAVSGMSLVEFLGVMMMLTLVSFAMLFAVCMLQKNQKLEGMQEETTTNNEINKKVVVFFMVLFVVSLLSVLRLLPYCVPLIIAVAGTFIIRKSVLAKVDYCLLLTFAMFFVFIGNMGRIEVVKNWLEQVIQGRELLFGFITSQVISNVPAAILLSGFTDNFKALLQGVNIGGLGTLIASLASLISYKFYAQEEQAKKGKYIAYFTGMNVVFAVVLLVVATLIN